MSPRLAIAHDYLTQRGGAERVVLAMARAFPEAEIHTLFHAPEQTYPDFAEHRIRTSGLNRVGVLRRDPRRALPLLRRAAGTMHIDADLVVASSSGWAHAFPARGRKVVYCHSPARWLYLEDDYLRGSSALDPRRAALRVLGPSLRRWDRAAAAGAEVYLANSTVVRERIRDVYGREARLLFPPLDVHFAGGEQVRPGQLGEATGEGTASGHFLVVSRLQAYKHVDQVVEAFRSLPGRRLVVVGDGPERARLEALAPPGVTFLRGLSDAELRWTYARARALIAVSHEDFGLTPLEASGHGVPTIALRRGGYLDTVREGRNGIFVEAPDAAEITRAVQRLEALTWDPGTVRETVEDFGEDRFAATLRELVHEEIER